MTLHKKASPFLSFAKPTSRQLQHADNACCIDDLRTLAKKRLPRAVFDFYDGGAEKEIALRAIVHIPYSGSSQSQSDVIGGTVDMTFDTLISTLPHVKSGRLTALAVSTSTRAKLEPSIATLQEQGVPDFNMAAWLGFVAPKGTPPEIMARLHAEISAALKDPVISEKLEALGTEVMASESPEAFSNLVVDNYKTWGDIIKKAAIERS